MFPFYLSGKSGRGDAGHVLRAQVLRRGDNKCLCLLSLRGEGSFVTVKLDPPPFLGGVPFSCYTSETLAMVRMSSLNPEREQRLMGRWVLIG